MNGLPIDASYELRVNGWSVTEELRDIFVARFFRFGVSNLIHFVNKIAGKEVLLFVDMHGPFSVSVLGDDGEYQNVMVVMGNAVRFPEIETFGTQHGAIKIYIEDQSVRPDSRLMQQECIHELVIRGYPPLIELMNVMKFLVSGAYLRPHICDDVLESDLSEYAKFKDN